MMEGPRHQHLHQEWQKPLEERFKRFAAALKADPRLCGGCSAGPEAEVAGGLPNAEKEAGGR